MDVDSTQGRMAAYMRDHQEKVVGRWSELVAAGVRGPISAVEVRREIEDLYSLVIRSMSGADEQAYGELRAALAELPERTRTVLALRYFDSMEYQTIASTLGLSLGNVKTLIHRGKIALTKKMREREAAAQESLPCATQKGGTSALLLV